MWHIAKMRLMANLRFDKTYELLSPILDSYSYIFCHLFKINLLVENVYWKLNYF